MRLPDGAWAVLEAWLPPDDDPDRPQVTLSTVDADGGPDARTVLLSSVAREGLSFHTDATSRKVAQIRANPLVAVTVLWPGSTHQLVVRGRAEHADPLAVAAAYAARSPYLQQLAWLNTHEFAALSLDERRARWAAAESEREVRVRTAGGTGLEPPPTWAGFIVRPTRVTAWSSAPDTASRREEWVLDDRGWAHSCRAG